jgi:hypothetical protein
MPAGDRRHSRGAVVSIRDERVASCAAADSGWLSELRMLGIESTVPLVPLTSGAVEFIFRQAGELLANEIDSRRRTPFFEQLCRLDLISWQRRYSATARDLLELRDASI